MPQPGNFWSRRRAAVEAEAKAEAEARLAAEAQAQDQALAAAQAEKTDAEILTDLGLPNPDGMAMGDNFAAFLQKSVPEHLRRRALRKLWLSNPVLANLDGLLDHNDDFSDAATVTPDLKTTYQVGRGLLAHVEALARDEALAQDESLAREAEADQTASVVASEVAAETSVVETAAGKKPSDAVANAALTAGSTLACGDVAGAANLDEPAVGLPEYPPEPALEPVRPRHLRFEFAR